jgi:alpha-methylacyl-CoA racemase
MSDPAPHNDHPNQPVGPLKGLRVVELAGIGPVPLCGQLLADQGADVVLVDRISRSGLGLDLPRRFEVNLRGRRSLAVDTTQPAGRALVLRLVAQADVLLEGFRPGTTERLGLGPADCLAVNPRLVYGRMTGFGQTGPMARMAGHDLNYLALSGALSAIGTPGAPPVPPLNLVADYGGGALYLAFGVMAALYQRQTSGRGQVVDAAMVDGAASLSGIFHGLRAAGQWQAPRGENLLDGGAPFYACYATADGRWLAVAPLEPKFFAIFLALAGLDEAWLPRQHDRAAWPALRAAIAARLAERTRDEWTQVFADSDACVAPVLDMGEAPHHAHAQARQAFIHVDGLVQPGVAPRMGGSPVPRSPRPPPLPGADTAQILNELGYAPDEVQQLVAQHVVALA